MRISVIARDPVIGLIDEVSRMNGRLRTAFAGASAGMDYSEAELTVLNAIVEASRPPTVPQIGRALGHPRQPVQRAVNTLVAGGLAETRPNPDHKRAPLLVATAAGIALKEVSDERALTIAAAMAPHLDMASVAALTQGLKALRGELETYMRKEREAE